MFVEVHRVNLLLIKKTTIIYKNTTKKVLINLPVYPIIRQINVNIHLPNYGVYITLLIFRDFSLISKFINYITPDTVNFKPVNASKIMRRWFTK
jgi:hypothetical protein